MSSPIDRLGSQQTNPFAVDAPTPRKQGQTRITKVADGITPTTVPLAFIIGLIVGVAVHCIAAHLTSNAHTAVLSGIGAGVASFGLTVGSAVLSARKNLDEENKLSSELSLNLQD